VSDFRACSCRQRCTVLVDTATLMRNTLLSSTLQLDGTVQEGQDSWQERICARHASIHFVTPWRSKLKNIGLLNTILLGIDESRFKQGTRRSAHFLTLSFRNTGRIGILAHMPRPMGYIDAKTTWLRLMVRPRG
jgi:hypothetical protein